MDNKYSEWRVLTPALLAILSVSGLVIGYLVVDKLSAMSEKTDRAFTVISSVKTSFDDYKVVAEGRFSRIETELSDIPKKIGL